MEENERIEFESPVPYKVHERDMARIERANKRLWITILALVVLLVATNAGWIWYESQFIEETTETVETSTDGGGNAYGTIVSGDNSEVNYGESQSHENDPQS